MTLFLAPTLQFWLSNWFRQIFALTIPISLPLTLVPLGYPGLTWLTWLTPDEPLVTQGHPWVTQGDLWVTQGYPWVTQVDPWWPRVTSGWPRVDKDDPSEPGWPLHDMTVLLSTVHQVRTDGIIRTNKVKILKWTKTRFNAILSLQNVFSSIILNHGIKKVNCLILSSFTEGKLAFLFFDPFLFNTVLCRLTYLDASH